MSVLDNGLHGDQPFKRCQETSMDFVDNPGLFPDLAYRPTRAAVIAIANGTFKRIKNPAPGTAGTRLMRKEFRYACAKVLQAMFQDASIERVESTCGPKKLAEKITLSTGVRFTTDRAKRAMKALRHAGMVVVTERQRHRYDPATKKYSCYAAKRQIKWAVLSAMRLGRFWAARRKDFRRIEKECKKGLADLAGAAGEQLMLRVSYERQNK